MKITISGPPGSGKTTVCDLLSERLGLKSIVFGKIFRQLAADRNMSLAEFGALAEKDPSIDKSIDDHILEIARTTDDIILESRLSAHILKKNGIPAFKVYLTATEETRTSRIGEREDKTKAQSMKETIDRQASEAKRYMMYYGIDVTDMSVYDLVLPTDDITPEQVVERIIGTMEGKC